MLITQDSCWKIKNVIVTDDLRPVYGTPEVIIKVDAIGYMSCNISHVEMWYTHISLWHGDHCYKSYMLSQCSYRAIQ